MESRAQASVVSKVCNINEVSSTINEHQIIEAIISSFSKFFGATSETTFRHTMKAAEVLADELVS